MRGTLILVYGSLRPPLPGTRYGTNVDGSPPVPFPRTMAKHIEHIHAAAAELAAARAATHAWAGEVRARATQHEADVLARARQAAERRLQPERAAYDAELARVGGLLSSIHAAGPVVAPWDDRCWSEWVAPAAPPPFARFGELRLQGRHDSIRSPALFPFLGGRNLLFLSPGESRSRAVKGIQSLMLRLLGLVPPAKLKLLMIDPVGLGENVGVFMNLKRFGSDLVGGKVWVERVDIERQLADLSAHMETVIQTFLRGRFATIEEYNTRAGEVAEAYRLLVVVDFPIGFTEESARRLVSVARNGPRCGVLTLLTVDPSQRLPPGFNLADLEATAHVLSADGDGFRWADEDFAGATVLLDEPPEVEQVEAILARIGEAARTASVIATPFGRIAPPPDAWSTGDTSYELSVAIGRQGATETQLLTLGKGTAQHALVVGRTGSGKSTLLHIAITSMCMAYPPDELELYLIDFKKGVEFKAYAEHALPHARVVAIESEREFGLSVLQALDQELKDRGEKFRTHGANTLDDYRRASGRPLPRVLLLVDEFHEFFSEDDALGREASLLLDRLARQGRAFGMHVLLGSQTLAGTYSLSRSTLDQMGVRIALQCSEADSLLVLSKDNPAARLLSRPGDAFYNAMNGLKEGNSRFQVAWLEKPEHERCLRQVRERADAEPAFAAKRPVVFEGNAAAQLEIGSDHPIARAATGDGAHPAAARLQAWLGDAVALRPPTAATFFRRGGRNLVVVGRDEEEAQGVLSAAICSLAAQRKPSQASFRILDLGMEALEGRGFAAALAAVLPHEVRLLEPRGLAAELADVAGLVASRQDAAPRGGEVFLALAGLHRARALRRDEGLSRRGEAPGPMEHLLAILRDGPEAGVHVLVWAETVAALTAALDRRALGDFGLRVALTMPEKESSDLLGSGAASRLKPHRAVLYDEERPSELHVFRPYALPTPAWLAWLGAGLRNRTHLQPHEAR